MSTFPPSSPSYSRQAARASAGWHGGSVANSALNSSILSNGPSRTPGPVSAPGRKREVGSSELAHRPRDNRCRPMSLGRHEAARVHHTHRRRWHGRLVRVLKAGDHGHWISLSIRSPEVAAFWPRVGDDLEGQSVATEYRWGREPLIVG